MTFTEMIQRNIKLYGDNRVEFANTFHVPLRKFWDNLCGFDIVKFDRWVLCPENRSLSSWLKEHFNDEAHDLIVKLIGG